MNTAIKLAWILPLVLVGFAAGVPLFGLPATLTLPRGQRPSKRPQRERFHCCRPIAGRQNKP